MAKFSTVFKNLRINNNLKPFLALFSLVTNSSAMYNFQYFYRIFVDIIILQ